MPLLEYLGFALDPSQIRSLVDCLLPSDHIPSPAISITSSTPTFPLPRLQHLTLVFQFTRRSGSHLDQTEEALQRFADARGSRTEYPLRSLLRSLLVEGLELSPDCLARLKEMIATVIYIDPLLHKEESQYESRVMGFGATLFAPSLIRAWTD